MNEEANVVEWSTEEEVTTLGGDILINPGATLDEVQTTLDRVAHFHMNNIVAAWESGAANGEAAVAIGVTFSLKRIGRSAS